MIDIPVINSIEASNSCQHQSGSVIDDPGRRKFLKQLGLFFGGLTIVGTASSLVESCSSASNPVGLQAGNTAASITISVASLTANGQALVTTDVGPDGAPIIVYRQTPTVYQAHSMVCTHAGCPLDPPSGSTMFCQCHGSMFNLTGGVVQGPAQSPLRAYPTTFDSVTNHLIIKFK